MAKVKTVFLSSTGRDLVAYREAAYRAVEDVQGHHCVRMENFGARDAAAEDFCPQKVIQADIFVGILGHCQGSCPAGSDKSYTEQEYDAAVAAGKPRLMFLAREDLPLPANLIESDDKRAKQRAFRDRVSGERIRDTFASPEDLARRVVAALHNVGPAARDRSGLLTPLPPQPYFAHPYPLQANFTGRVREREMLTEWLTKDNRPVFALIAIGGMGKSALTWVWVNRDVLGLPLVGQPDDPPDVARRCRVAGKVCHAERSRGISLEPQEKRDSSTTQGSARNDRAGEPVIADAGVGGGTGVGGTGVPPVFLDGVLWWSFYESQASFDSFVRAAIAYASGGEVDPASIPSTYDGCQMLLTLLGQKRILLVLDGLERILNAYARLDSAYIGDEVMEDPQQDFRQCTDPNAQSFLRASCTSRHPSRILVTSRLFPRELDELPGCYRQDLRQFQVDDATVFFHAQGVNGTHAEFDEQFRRYGLHPLALRLLSGMIVQDPARPGDIAVASGYSPIGRLTPRKHDILKIAYDALSKRHQQLLSRLAAFRFPMDFAAVKAISNLRSEASIKQALNELCARGLAQRSHGEPPRFDLHPIIRQYAYDRLADKGGAHARLCDYFAVVPAVEKSRIHRLDDLAPAIELYHHMCCTKRYDEALSLFRERIANALYFRLGDYVECIRLASELVRNKELTTPSGDAANPLARDQEGKAWFLQAIGAILTQSGKPRSADPFFRASLRVRGRMPADLGLMIALGNCADQKLCLGELSSAESILHRLTKVCRQCSDVMREALTLTRLGRLLAYRGAFLAARRTLLAAVSRLRPLRHPNLEGIARAHMSMTELLTGHAKEAAKEASMARALASQVADGYFPYERDFARAEWLLASSKVALVEQGGNRQTVLWAEAEMHLGEALGRCRRINLVEFEPNILLTWGRWHRAKGDREEARECAQEGLGIADRCEYRLCQADIHNFLAQLALDEGDKKSALHHAQIGRERAECDGKPHWYKPAVDEAERLLKEAKSG